MAGEARNQYVDHKRAGRKKTRPPPWDARIPEVPDGFSSIVRLHAASELLLLASYALLFPGFFYSLFAL